MELLFICADAAALPAPDAAAVRWLSVADYECFSRHLALCGQKSLPLETWRDIRRQGTRYCGFFAEGEMIARAGMEILTPSIREVADVRTAAAWRGRGCARSVAAFVAAHILAQGFRATIRTEADNSAMLRVIARLGFSPLGPAEQIDLNTL